MWTWHSSLSQLTVRVPLLSAKTHHNLSSTSHADLAGILASYHPDNVCLMTRTANAACGARPALFEVSSVAHFQNAYAVWVSAWEAYIQGEPITLGPAAALLGECTPPVLCDSCGGAWGTMCTCSCGELSCCLHRRSAPNSMWPQAFVRR